MTACDRVTLRWEIHGKCNYRCPYCSCGDTRNADADRYPPFERVIGAWQRKTPESVHISITGGEPFLYPRFEEIVDALSRRHLVSIETNLSCDSDVLRRMACTANVWFRPAFHPLCADRKEFMEKVWLLKKAGRMDAVSYLAWPPLRNVPQEDREAFARHGIALNIIPFRGEYNGVRYPGWYSEEERDPLSLKADGPARSRPRKPFDASNVYGTVLSDGTILGCGGPDDKIVGNLFDESAACFPGLRSCAPEEESGEHFDTHKKALLDLFWAIRRRTGQEGCRQRANDILSQINKSNVQPKVFLEAGRELTKAGEHELAAMEWEKALELVPESNVFQRNKVRYEIEMMQRRTVLQAKPHRLSVVLTSRCNLRCGMCSWWGLPEAYDLPVRAVQEVRGLFPYLEEIGWSGGEVFLSKHFEGLFREASTYGHLRQVITTNGLLVDERWAELLMNATTTYAHSVDGVTRETYERLRIGATFDGLMKSVKAIKKYKRRSRHNVSTILVFTVMRSNYREIEKALEFAKEHEYDCLLLSPMNGYFKEEDLFGSCDRETAEYLEDSRARVLEKARSCGLSVIYQLPRFGVQGNAGQDDAACAPGDNRRMCALPWRSLHLNYLGDVQVACYCRSTVGRIQTASLEEIWNGAEMQACRQRISRGCLDECSSMCVNGQIDAIYQI